MKTVKILLLALVLATSVVAGENLSEADQKWRQAVEKMIAAGPATISTPTESRVQIAKQLAEKAGRKAEVERTKAGFRIKIS